MIYLERHGQTEFNAEGRLQGQVDSPLTERGLDQARRLGETLRGLIPAPGGWRIVASPLGRARRTAEIMSRTLGWGEVELEPRLIELSWGAWDGRLRSELAVKHPEAFGETGWAFRAPTGEPYDSVQARMADWLSSLPPEPERKVIAVSHGVAGRVLRGVYAGLSRAETVIQEAPQDAVYRLVGGTLEKIPFQPQARMASPEA